MISWHVHGPLDKASYDHAKAEISRALNGSGLFVAYELDEFPWDLLDADKEIAGVLWRDVYMRGGWGGGGPAEASQIFDFLVLNVWPLAKDAGKVAGASAIAGFVGKAAADAWDQCREPLKRALKPILHKNARTVVINVVTDPEPTHDCFYDVRSPDVDTLDEAVDSIIDHARARFLSGTTQEASGHFRWDSHARKVEPKRHHSD
jgi:hypothetical protein